MATDGPPDQGCDQGWKLYQQRTGMLIAETYCLYSRRVDGQWLEAGATAGSDWTLQRQGMDTLTKNVIKDGHADIEWSLQ